MVNLIAADFRSDGIRTQHKGEGIGALNAALNLLPLFFTLGNTSPIHPGLALLCLNCFTQSPYKVNVLAGIGDENIGSALW